MNNILKYVKYIGGGDIQCLTDNLGITVKEYDNYYVLNYSQCDSPKTHPVVMECRGIILRKSDLQVVCRPFSRFFNYGEHGCPEDIDFSKCIVREKIDGSLCKLWWDDIEGVWQIATRGTAYAESEVFSWGITFRELFLRAAGKTEDEFQQWAKIHLYEGMTYLFELACRENRVVTPYEKDTLVLLAMRSNTNDGHTNGYAYPYHGDYWLQEINARYCVEYPLSSIDKINNAVTNLGGLKEGFVVYQNYIPVCKIKSPLYVKLHYIRGNGLTPSKIVDIVWEGEVEEYLTYFPEDSRYLMPYENAYNRMIYHINSTVFNTKDVTSQKEFALLVKDLPISGIMFNYRKGLTLTECIAKVSQSNRKNILDQYL